MTHDERQAALEQIADEVRVCTRCRLHQQRTRAVPGEGNPDTEVAFVGEGPGFNEDREGRPFVGRAGGLLVRLLGSVGWQREDVFITNVVKCRPPDNRDPEADEIAACAPFLKRQLEALDPALVVTLGRYSMGTFMPGARISQAHGTVRPVPPETGAADALVLAMYHPAAALRATEIERTSFQDMAGVPVALVRSRELRERHAAERAAADVAAAPANLAAAAPAELAAEPAAVLQEGLNAGLSATSQPEPATFNASRDIREPEGLVAAGVAPTPANATAFKPSGDLPRPGTAALEPDPSADQLTIF